MWTSRGRIDKRAKRKIEGYADEQTHPSRPKRKSFFVLLNHLFSCLLLTGRNGQQKRCRCCCLLFLFAVVVCCCCLNFSPTTTTISLSYLLIFRVRTYDAVHQKKNRKLTQKFSYYFFFNVETDHGPQQQDAIHKLR